MTMGYGGILASGVKNVFSNRFIRNIIETFPFVFDVIAPKLQHLCSSDNFHITERDEREINNVAKPISDSKILP
jgi:hypothetical protein